MDPQQLSNELRRIASKLDASRNPSRELVIRDLHRLANSIHVATRYYVALYSMVDSYLKGKTSMDLVLGHINQNRDKFDDQDRKDLRSLIKKCSDSEKCDKKVLTALENLVDPKKDSTVLESGMDQGSNSPSKKSASTKLSSELRRVASRLDASKNPSKELVVRDLIQILNSI